MGVNSAHNTVGKKLAPTITVCVRAVVEYYSYRRIGYGPWYRGLTCAPCPAILRLFLSPFQVGVPGRSVPVDPGFASRRRAVSRVFAYPGRRREVRV